MPKNRARGPRVSTILKQSRAQALARQERKARFATAPSSHRGPYIGKRPHFKKDANGVITEVCIGAECAPLGGASADIYVNGVAYTGNGVFMLSDTDAATPDIPLDLTQAVEDLTPKPVHEVTSNLASGDTVTISGIPNTNYIIQIYRNGKLQDEGINEDYTISGTTITFTVPFGGSGGGVAVEKVQVIYWQ